MSPPEAGRAPPPAWVENGSCHNPLLESDALYLVNNPIVWTEVFKAIILFFITFLTIFTNICFLFGLNFISFRRFDSV